MIGNRDGSTPPRIARESAATDLTTERLCGLLSDSLRRRALRALDPDEGTVALSQLADRIADESDREVEMKLHHHHLPKLDEAGLVRYDGDENVVEARPQPDMADQYLEL
ncbi:helix-turn-helix domain-containing protein [Halorussus gelatinilyticus]|uniref:Helix-turn-helix domain-containing protein n=1 Tax=Halorussus gelatinilyticus TaxID=2937524 RepID=A0A8U0IHZ5_9EURY|nr:helix-turn-helix domain-containing protein [Halorussus gelatinilyticus]UPW00291.1 helix-turn-helix domain-containing protein [Halorussus gelatinilyticus]